MAAFGKHGAAAPSCRPYRANFERNTENAPASIDAGNFPAPASIGLIRPALYIVVGTLMAFIMAREYGPELVRDLRLSGTWEYASDMRVTDVECKRDRSPFTDCDVTIEPRSGGAGPSVKSSFFVGLMFEKNAPMTPVRSRADAAALSVDYAVTGHLLNRALSFFVLMGMFIAMVRKGVLSFLMVYNNGGRAHRASGRGPAGA